MGNNCRCNCKRHCDCDDCRCNRKRDDDDKCRKW